MVVVGHSADIRSQIFDEDGQIRAGVVVVKLVGKFGPYGYRVTYERGLVGEGHHDWEYLGLAEPGLSTGTYAPGTPLRFFRGHARNIRDKLPVLVGNWNSLLTNTELDIRLETAGYLEEVID
jgi:hypothetical protein